MGRLNIEEKVEQMIKPIINNLNYELYDVQFIKEGKDYYLRITIDNEKGISLDDCELVSNSINDTIDNCDFITEAYFLEVSSPGIERVLRKPEHYKSQINNKIFVKLYKVIDNKKEYIGILKEYNENSIKLDLTDKVIDIDIKDIALAKQYYE